MTDHERVFRYKLDFYYQQALIYLVTLVLYGGIRGNFVEQKFEYVLSDPLIYVIIFFVLMSLVVLGLNFLRNRRLVITDYDLIFTHRWHEWRIAIPDIEWMHVGRELGVQTGGRFQVVVMKLKGRRRLLRVRLGRYERPRELLHEMNSIAARVPVRKRSRWRRPRFTDQ